MREVSSQKIAALRAVLRDLQDAGWSDLAPGDESLTALIIERGQYFLARETPNEADGTLYAWDTDDFFIVGEFQRLDEKVGHRSIVSLYDLDEDVIGRLTPETQRYMRPEIADPAAWARLHRHCLAACIDLRQASAFPITLLPRGVPAHPGQGHYPSRYEPCAFGSDLPPFSGLSLEKPRNGEWPPCRRAGHPPRPYTDKEKAILSALGALEDAKWRDLAAQAFKPSSNDPKRMMLVVGQKEAILRWNYTVWRVTAAGFELEGLDGFWPASTPGEYVDQD